MITTSFFLLFTGCTGFVLDKFGFTGCTGFVLDKFGFTGCTGYIVKYPKLHLLILYNYP